MPDVLNRYKLDREKNVEKREKHQQIRPEQQYQQDVALGEIRGTLEKSREVLQNMEEVIVMANKMLHNMELQTGRGIEKINMTLELMDDVMKKATKDLELRGGS
jgi:ribosomal protein L17